jgi:hypothetical protein
MTLVERIAEGDRFSRGSIGVDKYHSQTDQR